MKMFRCIMPLMFAFLALQASGSAEITNREKIATGDIPRPDHIWVYDFSATASDIPPESVLAGQHAEGDVAQTDEELVSARKLGGEIAAELIKQLQALGLPVGRATAETDVQLNDVVIRGHLVSATDDGSKKRVLIGFGQGGSELMAAVEGFQMTAEGLRRLGTANTKSTEGLVGKTPGVGVGALGMIATHNPLGLIVSTGVKAHAEKSGGGKLEGRAEDTGKEIAEMLGQRFTEWGWIDDAGN